VEIVFWVTVIGFGLWCTARNAAKNQDSMNTLAKFVGKFWK
jgi:hypothetical protein